MTRPRQSERTRQSLLAAGVNAFLEHGYHGTGIKQVLDEVNVPKGSFYNYFESKEAYASAAIQHYADCFVAQLDAALASNPDPVLGLHAFFGQLMAEFEAANYAGGCLIANLGGELENSDMCRGTLSRAFRSWRDRVESALALGQEQGSVRADIPPGELADLLTESWEGAVIRMKLERSRAPLQRIVTRLLDDYFRP